MTDVPISDDLIEPEKVRRLLAVVTVEGWKKHFLKKMFSGGSNNKHLNSEPIQNQNVLKIGIGMVRTIVVLEYNTRWRPKKSQLLT